MSFTTRLVEVRTKILKENDVAARRLRQRFAEQGRTVISLVSSPGAGKTRLLEETVRRLATRYRVAVVVGDLATDNDAERLAGTGVLVKQITTGTVCHLEAEMVSKAIDSWSEIALDFLFLENVGNLVCPAGYDLGENLRIVAFSVTEGEDKPLKYPTIFNTADAVVLTKMDLCEATEFDEPEARRSIRQVRPGMRVMKVSAKTGEGMADWTAWLEKSREFDKPSSLDVGKSQGT